MAANDMLDLILETPDGLADEVPWARLTPVVESMELALASAVTEILSRRFRLTAETRNSLSRAVALLGAPRQGSLIVPFAFEMREIALALRQIPEAAFSTPDVGAVLGAMADATEVLRFARDLLFGERGVIARMQGSTTPEPPRTQDERAVAQLAPETLEALTQSVVTLMEAAERTGCTRVDVRVNDQQAISLLRRSQQRSPLRLAERHDAVQSTVKSKSFARISDAIAVTYAGEPLLAFVGTDEGHMGPSVFLWRRDASLPPLGERYAAEGTTVERQDLSVEDDIPEDWPAAKGVFLVRRFRANPDWVS